MYKEHITYHPNGNPFICEYRNLQNLRCNKVEEPRNQGPRYEIIRDILIYTPSVLVYDIKGNIICQMDYYSGIIFSIHHLQTQYAKQYPIFVKSVEWNGNYVISLDIYVYGKQVDKSFNLLNCNTEKRNLLDYNTEKNKSCCLVM